MTDTDEVWTLVDEALDVDRQPVQPVQPDMPVSPATYWTGLEVLDAVRGWLARFVSTVHGDDLSILALWAVHTHLVVETYTSPRLLLDSPVPGSGKTTTLEHLHRLAYKPVQMASVSSPAMLARLLDAGLRTLLIDEADRALSPDKEGIKDLLAVLNSGYKRGGTRPVNVPKGKNGWEVKEMTTFAPVAMAGNSPNLPEDTRSRSLRVLLMPDVAGQVEESDWEWIEHEAVEVHARIAAWADQVRDEVRCHRPVLPDGVRGRSRERWAPLKRVAVAVGGEWPDLVDRLAVDDVNEQQLEREEGVVTERPHVVLIRHIAEVWGSEAFLPTEQLIDRLVADHPETWGDFSSYGKRLTPQRLGRMLSGNYRVHTSRPDANGPRGYTFASLATPMRRFGLLPVEPALDTNNSDMTMPARKTGRSGQSGKPDEVAEPAEPAAVPNEPVVTCRQCGTEPRDKVGLGVSGLCLGCEGVAP